MKVSVKIFQKLFAAIGLAVLPAVNSLASEEIDIRRDATVVAVQKTMPSVVNVGTEQIVQVSNDPWEAMVREFFDPYYRNQQQTRQATNYSLGSGVIVDEEGYILTNDHVVRRANKIWVQSSTEPEIYSARLVATDSKTDIAILKIDGKPGKKFTAINFAPDDDLLLGETVLAMGNPFGLGGSVSRGILSSKNRMVAGESQQLDVPNWLQTDASINLGNSGGPLVNLRGELIGLNAANLRVAQGIGFAVPEKRVREAVAEILTPEALKQLWFGVKLNAGKAVFGVVSVQPGSPAQKAGLQAGDLILQANGKSSRNLFGFVEELVAGQGDVALTIMRNNERKIVKVRLVPESSVFNADLIYEKIGVRLQQSDQKFTVASVDTNSPAAKFLQPGYFINAIDNVPLSSVTDTAKFLYPKKKGDVVNLSLTAIVESVQRVEGLQGELRGLKQEQGSLKVTVLR